MDISIRKCRSDELEELRAIAYETYDETFRPMNKPRTINRYLAESFDRKKLAAEMTNPASHFYFLFADEQLAGYLKINEAPAQSDLNDPQSLEVERIYVRKDYKGKGLGTLLLNFALQLAEEMRKRSVWLGVWEKNTDAIAFYKKMGFMEAGRHTFRMGNELQSDWIMKKMVSPED